jgi:RNA polymerase sigma-70 factor (ECF subfamily)
MEEIQAIDLLENGDLRGLEFLVTQYQVRAVQAAYLILGDKDQAEDIAQAAFITAAEKIGQFDSARPFGPWFYRIVVHSAFKTDMREKRQLSLDDENEGSRLPAWLIDPCRSLEEMVESAEARQEVWQALGRLTVKQRTALVMRYYLKMADKEISRELGRPLSAIRWSIHAGHKRLRILLSVHRPLEVRPNLEEPCESVRK